MTDKLNPCPNAPGRTDGDEVILVNAQDEQVGVAPKMHVHREGLLHRAVSVFLFDVEGRVLLQRRALAKYHSGGLWSNTCCGHPRPGESSIEAARRRLHEEMGVTCAVMPAFEFVYRAELPNGLVEYELDHVFVGWFDGEPIPDPAEVTEWRWAALEAILADYALHPGGYTAWFRAALLLLGAEAETDSAQALRQRTLHS